MILKGLILYKAHFAHFYLLKGFWLVSKVLLNNRFRNLRVILTRFINCVFLDP